MKKLTSLYLDSFHAFLLVFLYLEIYLAGRQEYQIFISAIYAIGIVLSLGLIIVFILDVWQQGILERKKVLWSLLFVFIWPTIWIYAGWFTPRLKKLPD